MGLRFIIGSSISDKTEKIYRLVVREAEAHPERQYILLVPEQASLTTQQALIDLHPRHALFNIDVLTFNRLSHRVFDEMKVNTKNVLSENGKLMLLKLTVSRHEGELVRLKGKARRIGFLEELKSVMSELSQYNVDEKTLEESAEKVTEPGLKQKLKDIHVIYKAYLSLLHENYALSEEKLTLLSSVINDWAPVKETVFVLDGYTGFTHPQYKVIDALLEHGAGVVLGVTLGTGTSLRENRRKDDLFYMSAHMTEETAKLGEAHNLKAEEIFAAEPGLLEGAGDGSGEPDAAGPRAVSPEIRQLERALFRYPKPQPTEEDAAAVEEHRNVRIYRAKDKKEEVAIALSQILAAIREDGAAGEAGAGEATENGAGTRPYRYKDIAVVTGDPEGFREEIEAQFNEAGIPYFIDSTKELLNDPLFLLVKGLPVLVKNDFDFRDVFSLLKDPLVLKWAADLCTREQLLEAENYALARGLRGKSAYEKEWTGRYKGFDDSRLPELNRVREAVFGPFLAFAGAFKAAGTVSEKLDALRACLSVLNAEEGMAALAAEAEGETAREYAAAPELLSELLTEIEGILGGETLTNEEFADILATGIAGTGLRLAPPTKDRLVVGDLMRTRLTGIKKLFVLGANEGLLPRIGDGAGLLTDHDREMLAEIEKDAGGQGLKLADTAKEETFQSHFYLYLLMTLPSETLTVSYSLTGDDGSSLTPGFAVSELLSVFKGPGTPDGRPAETALRAEKFAPRDALLSTKPAVYRLLAEELREYRRADAEGKNDTEALRGEEQAKAIMRIETLASHYAWAFGEDRERAKNILEGAFYRYDAAPLDKAIARELYGEVLEDSVSRLENYASCPYKHFLDYGICLQEQKRYEADIRDFGTLFHNSVKAFFDITKKEERNWAELSDCDRMKYVQKSVGIVLENEDTDVFSSSNRNRYMISRVEQVTDRSLKTLQHQWKVGGFTDTETEVPFNSRKLKAFALPLSDGVMLSLKGRIDRIDSGENDGKIYVRVIDYKTGNKVLDFTKIYYGLQLQLLLYLRAAEEHLKERAPGKEIVPAGVYYYIMQDKAVDLDKQKKVRTTGDIEGAILQNMRLEGFTNIEDSALSMTDSQMGLGNSSTVANHLALTTKGLLHKNGKNNSFSGEELDRIAEYAVHKAKLLSEEISSGSIAAKPADGCTYCAYKAVCGHHARIPGHQEMEMTAKTREDLLNAGESVSPNADSSNGPDTTAGKEV
ncbi:MAG: PD-(D/E)XK nuclease family protein [Lachnospiraceae bacterium]|nr:PD-(D/E)XK nuclease family protein [Lachnospiraceae bacterium]